MVRVTTKLINLYGKPSERLILVALCKEYDCEFKYDEDTGLASYKGANVSQVDEIYKRILSVAYRGLAFAQAKSAYTNIPIKTLTSQYMQAFAAITYSVITGAPFDFRSLTEVHREGLKAASEVKIT